MAVLSVDSDNIKKVANAIRAKGGLSQTFTFPTTMALAIGALAAPSKCVSTLIENLSYNGERTIEIPIGDITKPQVISIVHVTEGIHTDDIIIIMMLTIFMDSDCSNVQACSSISKNIGANLYYHYDLNNTSFPSVTINGSTLTVDTSGTDLDEFAYDYRCTVYGT